jgi:hypothetical protein
MPFSQTHKPWWAPGDDVIALCLAARKPQAIGSDDPRMQMRIRMVEVSRLLQWLPFAHAASRAYWGINRPNVRSKDTVFPRRRADRIAAYDCKRMACMLHKSEHFAAAAMKLAGYRRRRGSS